jgi:hypothetical protein
MRDGVHNIATRQSIPAALYDASVEGEEVDIAGFREATFHISIGAWTDGIHLFAAEHRDNGDEWEPVPTGDLIGSFPLAEEDLSPPGSGAAERTHKVGYIGGRQFIRAITTVSGEPSTGAVYGADVILGRPRVAPTS